MSIWLAYAALTQSTLQTQTNYIVFIHFNALDDPSLAWECIFLGIITLL
jgi:hypothetical protein